MRVDYQLVTERTRRVPPSRRGPALHPARRRERGRDRSPPRGGGDGSEGGAERAYRGLELIGGDEWIDDQPIDAERGGARDEVGVERLERRERDLERRRRAADLDAQPTQLGDQRRRRLER